MSLDVFYYNDKLFIINAINKGVNMILIANAHSKKIMNSICLSKVSSARSSFITITVPKKPAEIYLLLLLKNKIMYCDVDEKEMTKEIDQSNSLNLNFEIDNSFKNKQTLIVGQTLKGLFLVSLVKSGLVGVILK